MLGASHLSELCTDMENQSREGLPEAVSLLRPIQLEYERVADALGDQLPQSVAG